MRRAAVISAIALAAVGAIWLKVRLEAGASMAQAQSLDAAGDAELAIVCYRRTIRWYSPGSGPVEAAVQRLRELGAAHEAAGRTELALLAWRSLRSALYGVRSVWQPYSGAIAEANPHIAKLMAEQEGGQDLEARVAHHEALLQKDHAPHVGWSLLAVLGFGAWCVALFGLAMRGFDDASGRLLARPAARWAGLIAATMATWMVALTLA